MDSFNQNSDRAVEAQPPPAAQILPEPSLGIRVFQNAVAVLGGRFIGLFFSASTSVLLARYLGRERLGEYGAIYAYLSLYGFFATFCLEPILAREISRRRDQANQLFHTGTLSALGFSLVGVIVAPLLAPLFNYSGSMRWLIVIAAIDMLVFPPIKFPAIILQVDMRLWYSVAVGVLRQALWLLAVVLLAMKSAAFYQVILARTLCGAAEVVITLWTIRHLRLVRGPREFLPHEARLMLRAGFPLVLSSVAVGIYHRIDQVMLHRMSGDLVLGPYVIAVQLTELFGTLPVALMVSLFPALSQSAYDPPRFERYLRESYRFLLVIVFAACTVVTPIAAPTVELFYGKEFLPTASLLIVLIWSEVPVFFGVVLANALIAKNLQRFMPYSTVAGAIANILLNLWLIPRYGALGSSWATVASYTISGIFFLLLFSETRPLVFLGLRISIWPLLLAVPVTVGVLPLPLAFWWKFLLSCLAYSVGAWITGALQPSDLLRLRDMFRKGLPNIYE